MMSFMIALFSLSVVSAQEIAKEDLPPAVLWGLGVYGGVSQPLAPDDFAYYWSTGFTLSMEADILLRNDMVLGLTFGYARTPLNRTRFFQAKGLPADSNPPQDLDVGIAHVLLAFKGMENYRLYRYDWGYEFGLGLYSMSNTQLYVQYWGPETGFTVYEATTASGGAFAGLSAKYLITDTLQLTLKGRFHYVLAPTLPHQYFDLALGLTLL